MGTRTVVFAVTGVSLMIAIQVFVVFWALKWGLGRAHPSPVGEDEEEEGGGGGAGLSAEEVGELPCHEFKEGAGGGHCAVCLEGLRAGDRCSVLPGCRHGFHVECVDSWLRKCRRCPICRAEVVARGKNAGAVAAAAALGMLLKDKQRRMFGVGLCLPLPCCFCMHAVQV
ncbi:hypothetical protein ACP70R_026281 [Stipagrostis hirtigluma subsp. patula]